MLITHNGLLKLLEQGVMTDVPLSRVNSASIDVTLGAMVWSEDPRGGIIKLAHKGCPALCAHDISRSGYQLMPGEFILAQTQERFFMPDDLAAEFRLKSSGARAGLEQSLAVWADPGWNGSVLTLELRNNLQHHTLLLEVNMPIGQMVFWRGEPVPREASYGVRGQYNNDTSATPSKGIR